MKEKKPKLKKAIVLFMAVLTVMLYSIPTLALDIGNTDGSAASADKAVSSTATTDNSESASTGSNDASTKKNSTDNKASSAAKSAKPVVLAAPLANSDQDLSVTLKDSSGSTVATLGSGSSATLDYTSDKSTGATYTLGIQATFASGATDKTIQVKLPAGMRWVSYVTPAYQETLTSNNITYTTAANTAADNAGGVAYTYQNFNQTGSVTYKCNSDKTKEVYIECQVAIDPKYHLSEISNAVQATLSSSAGNVSKTLEKVTTTPYVASIKTRNYGTYYRKTDTVYNNRDIQTYILLNNNATWLETPPVSALYKELSFEMTVSDPDAVIKLADPNWKLTDEGSGKYRFTAANILVDGVLKLPYTIEFPADKFQPNDKIVITNNGGSSTLYDGSTASYSGGNTVTYKIAPEVYVWVGFDNNDYALDHSPTKHVNSASTGPNGIYLDPDDYMGMVASYSFGNAGTNDSPAQMVNLNFDNTVYSVKAFQIQVLKDNPVTSIEYQINGESTWRKATVDFTKEGVKTVSYKQLGISYGDDITAVRYNVGAIPNRTYYNGLRLFGTVKKVDATADSTIEVFNKDDSSVTSGIGHFFTKTNEPAGDINITQSHNYIKQSGSKFSFMGTMGGQDYWYARHQVYATKHPILYIRSETGCDISNFKIKYDVTGDDVTSSCEISTFKDALGCVVYKIDTKNLGKDEYNGQVGGVVVNADGNVVNPSFSFSYDIQTNKSTKEGIFKYTHMLFGYDPVHTKFGSATWAGPYAEPGNYDTTELGIQLNTDGAGGMMGYAHKYYGYASKSTDYYQIKNVPAINVWNEAKKSSASEWTDTPYSKGDDKTIIDVGAGSFDLRTVIQNNCNIATGTGTVVYQPVPKEGEDWGKLTSGIDSTGAEIDSLAWTGKLTKAITNPDSSKWKITYGVGIKPSDNYDTLDGQTFVAAADVSDWSKVNCVRIEAISNMDVDEEQKFDMTVVKTSYSDEGKGTDIISPIFYRKCINSEGAKYATVVDTDNGATLYAFKLAAGTIKGTLWDDKNGNGKLESGESVIDGTKDGWSVTLYKAGDTSTALATAKVGEDGTYMFTGLMGTEKSYDLVVENKLSGQHYRFSRTGTTADSNKFTGSSDEKTGTAAAASAVYEPGTAETKDDGESYDGIYDIGVSQAVTVTYDGNGNTSGKAPVDADSPYEYNGTATVLDKGDIAKEHYTFTGWDTKADGTGTRYKPGDTFKATEDVVLYAQWKLNSHTVKYDGNGNEMGTAPLDPTVYDYGSSVTVMANTGALSKTGYTFDSWNTKADGSGTKYTGTDKFSMPDNDVILYAQYTINQYELTYDGNGNETGTAPVDGKNPYDFNTQVTVLGNTDLAKEGYTFSGWNTEKDGSGKSYVKDDTFAMPAADMTLFAQYEINIYTVTFDSNGGNYTPDQQKVAFKEKAQSPDDPLKKGYTFTGWYYKDKDENLVKYDFNEPVTADITLYAGWKTAPQLTISKRLVTAGEIKSGDTIEYTIMISNSGETDALDVTVFDEPLGLDFVRWTETAGITFDRNDMKWTIANVGAGKSVTITYYMKVREGVTSVNNAGVLHDNDGNNHTSKTRTSVKNNNSHPRTGDSSMIGIYSATGIAAVILLMVLIAVRRTDKRDA
jgi:uncharacterized repeat protein (TIGR01451 family)/uncharacterized repeat protein (TIGR02543 family)